MRASRLTVSVSTGDSPLPFTEGGAAPPFSPLIRLQLDTDWASDSGGGDTSAGEERDSEPQTPTGDRLGTPQLGRRGQ